MNETRCPAGWTMGFDRDGREVVVVVVKATFDIPPSGQPPGPADEQVGLTEADEFTGEPGLSAPSHETDYAHRKVACDVVLNGSAYAPPERMARQVAVGIKVGSMSKSFVVVGNRYWHTRALGLRATSPEPFGVMRISYDNAFGGIDHRRDDPATVTTFLENPVGCGYSPYKEDIDGRLLPNTEELGRTIEDPGTRYRPMSFGAIGRNWQPRVRFAGTYDRRWIETRAPFWPDDFDVRYFQSAGADQQVPFLSGGEEVVLHNLTPDGRASFSLPTLNMPVLFVPHRGRDREVAAQADTLLLEPDLGRFGITWRASLPMRRSCFDIKRIIAGEMPRSWHAARRSRDKPYYRGLAELARARRGLR